MLLAGLGGFGFIQFRRLHCTRLRAPSTGTPELTEFRDGIDGLLVWALATLLTGLIALAIVQSTARLATTSGTSAETSVAGENIIAYDLDRLLRSDRRPQGIDGPTNYQRAEAARILLTASSHRGMQADDRSYLVRLVSALTGLAPPDAERRVNQVTAQAKENISRARRSRRHSRIYGWRCCPTWCSRRVVCRLCDRPSPRSPRNIALALGLEPANYMVVRPAQEVATHVIVSAIG